MSKQYIVHWSPVPLEPLKLLNRVEPILAGLDFRFSGEARRLEKESGALYYQFETMAVKRASASDVLQSAFSKGWSGVALSLIYKGYVVPLSFFCEAGQCSMMLDEESPLFYELRKSEKASQLWLNFLLQMTTSIGAAVCLFEKNPKKRVLDPIAVAESVRREGLIRFENPVVAIIQETLLPFEQVRELHFDGIKIRMTTNGYSMLTWLEPS